MSLLSSICDFFGNLFSSDTAQSSQSNNDGLTGVERYIRDQKSSESKPLTGVEQYIQNQPALTGVARYILNQANAPKLTSVEQYIRNQG